MSLINEALKKAQRVRTVDPVDVTAGPDGGMRIERRAPPRSTKTLLLYASGVLVLFVLAVVTTVYFINRPAPRTPASAPHPLSASQSGTQPPAAAPEIVAPKLPPPPVMASAAESTPPPIEKPVVTPASAPPVIATTLPSAVAAVQAPPPTTVSSAPAPRPIVSTPGPEPTPSPKASPAAPATVQARPVSTVPAPAQTATTTPVVATQTPAAAPAAPKLDDRINLYLDALKVTGVRPSGTESRVLMNDRVYRVNDIVDRSLSLRLTKVEPGILTFTDANGMTYVKYF